MSYKVENGTIFSRQGLPYAPRWFCDGRIAFQTDNESITQIDYFGPETRGSYIAFLKKFWRGLTFYSVYKGSRQVIRPRECEILPFGFNSLSERCLYGVFAANDCIYMTFQPLTDMDIAVEFYDDFFFYPETRKERDIRYGGVPRTWTPLSFNGKVLTASYEEEGKRTNVAISSNAPLTFQRTPKNPKNILTLTGLSRGEDYVLAMGFSNREPKSWPGYETILKEQQERYRQVAEKAPVLESCHPLLDQFFQLAPMYHESLKTRDVPGAIRAQSTHYWVWGWDSMTSNDCSVYWGDLEFVGQMLDCMETHSDPEIGIAHAFMRDMSVCDAAAPPPAQGMYITLLDLYAQAGGDWKKHYPFARKIFETIAASEVRDIGLCRGTSLYPDFRSLIKETGNDISAFNNTVSYCAIRSMEQLARKMEDDGTAGTAAALAQRMQEGFEKLLYNPAMGFIDSSIEADTYEQRSVPSNNAVKWENNFCGELIAAHARDYLAFYEKHLVSPAGLRPLPEWHECYDIDANQLHCWWPVMSELYIRLINRFDRPDLMKQYIGWIEYWSQRLTCPEGISCYDNVKEVPFDPWNCLCGIWHGYSIRGFYNAVVHGFVGVDFDQEGFHIYPYSGEEVSLTGLHFGERTFDITVKGSGPTVTHVKINGQDFGAVTTIPLVVFELQNTVEIVRG